MYHILESDLPELHGTPKQVEWASDLRRRTLISSNALIDETASETIKSGCRKSIVYFVSNARSCDPDEIYEEVETTIAKEKGISEEDVDVEDMNAEINKIASDLILTKNSAQWWIEKAR
jgi:hypothetical protein